jgi:hypothetical protein
MDVSAILSLPIEGTPIHHEMKCTQYCTIDIDTNGATLGYTRFYAKTQKNILLMSLLLKKQLVFIFFGYANF